MLNKMREMFGKMKSVARNEKGATMVEYALMLALIAVVAVAAVQVIGQRTDATYDAVSTNLTPVP